MKDWQRHRFPTNLYEYVRQCRERLLAAFQQRVEVLGLRRTVIGWQASALPPAVAQLNPRAAPPRLSPRRPHMSGRLGTVLVVDDDENILRALETLIAEAGYAVLTATNGKEALEKARSERPDVVVSDVMMPVMDGPALVNALAADRRLSNVPVVLNSAVAAPPHVSVSAFLKKPYAPAQLLRLIHDLVMATACSRQ